MLVLPASVAVRQLRPSRGALSPLAPQRQSHLPAAQLHSLLLVTVAVLWRAEGRRFQPRRRRILMVVPTQKFVPLDTGFLPV